MGSSSLGKSADVMPDANGLWDLEGTAHRQEEDADNNSPAAVAVRLALMASISSMSSTHDDKHVEQWTYEHILSWVRDAVDRSLEAEDRTSGAMSFWRDWEAIDHHLAPSMRNNFVQAMDDRMNAKGFPSLRELIETI